MRLSHQHKFVYISIHKTASSTVREMLDPYSDIKSCAPRKTICYHHIPAKKMKVRTMVQVIMISFLSHL